MKHVIGSIAIIAAIIILSACGTQQTARPANMAASTAMPAAGAMTTPAMGHGTDQSGMGMSQSQSPYDAQFIDSMIKHHQGAIAMANQALKEGEKPEVKQLAQDIVKAQEAEITQMQGWRKAWYPDLAPTNGMGMDMGMMEIATDSSKPFDRRFIEAMIPHHEGAIAMATDAQQNAEHAEIKTLAGEIITAQQAEIAQMHQWKQQWFGQ